jgi:peptide/nickel transport system substrate-binding protein
MAQERMLKVAGPWEIAGIDPAQSGYVFSRLQVAETLVSADATGKLIPGLAEKWSVSDDGRIWRFTIRRDATFHDATPVTAEAAAASLKHAHAGVGVLTQLPILEIASDDQDVVIRLEKPFAAVPAYLVNFSTIVLAPASYDASGKVTQIIGSGPYKVKSLTPPLKLELEGSDKWWGGEPGIGEVSYLAVGQGETRALMAESGEADLVFSMLPVSVERLKRNRSSMCISPPSRGHASSR